MSVSRFYINRHSSIDHHWCAVVAAFLTINQVECKLFLILVERLLISNSSVSFFAVHNSDDELKVNLNIIISLDLK